MKKVILFKNSDGGFSIVIPSEEYLLTHTIEDCAAKDVPEGVEYKIIDASELPQDRTFRSAWEYQE
jgi:hypothetical protein